MNSPISKPSSSPKNPLVLAHRGVTSRAPENSLESFAAAHDLGLDGVELDLQVTADAELVCFHDEDLKRLANRPERVSELTRAELAKIAIHDAGHTGSIAFFPQALELLADCAVINLELKGAFWKPELLQAKLLEPITAHGLEAKIIISSFYFLPLLRIKKIAPQLRRGILIHEVPLRLGKPAWSARWLQPYSIHPEDPLATPGRIALWKAAGYVIYVWTVNDSARFEQLAAEGVAGVISDQPEKLLKR